MHKLILILLIFLSCVTEKSKTAYNQILSERYIVYNNFPSKHIMPRNVEIWLPTEYDNIQSLPVLYMFDGQNIFHGKKRSYGNRIN